jgi:hypothetical protein
MQRGIEAESTESPTEAVNCGMCVTVAEGIDGATCEKQGTLAGLPTEGTTDIPGTGTVGTAGIPGTKKDLVEENALGACVSARRVLRSDPSQISL